MTSAPLAISGLLVGSNLIQKISPVLSWIVKPGVTPSDFLARIVHVPDAGPVPVSGPLTRSATGSIAAADPIGEPARVRHLADRVDVLGTFPRVVACTQERVLDQVVLSADVEVLHVRRVLSLGIVRDRDRRDRTCGAAAPPGAAAVHRPAASDQRAQSPRVAGAQNTLLNLK